MSGGWGPRASSFLRRQRSLFGAAIEPRSARDAASSVLAAYLHLHVRAAPADRDVVAAVATLAEVGGGSPFAFAQRRAVDPVEHDARHVVGVGGEGLLVDAHHLEEDPDAAHDRRHWDGR